jgi:putative Mg2+ transporter-C (MgtC) family protein
MTTFEIILRLLAAVLAGGFVGLNRELHAKSLGLRTLAIVGLGACVATIAAAEYGHEDGATRVMQGILTGIGFLGAGVIVHRRETSHVKNLTTAASVFFVACLGVACAVAQPRLIVAGALLGLAILIWGGPVEKNLVARFGLAEDKGRDANPPDAA